MTEPETTGGQRIRLELPRYWEAQTGIRIYDPDGWRAPYEKDYNEPITHAEFMERAMRSTVSIPVADQRRLIDGQT